jgi:hypothetical protein
VKISAFTTILQLKNEAEFTWGSNQQHAFEDVKRYLSLPLVMKAPMTGIPFWLYIATEDVVIGAVLTQVTEVKEHIITYLSQCLIDAKQGIEIQWQTIWHNKHQVSDRIKENSIFWKTRMFQFMADA